jgi:carbonic anhydrase/acetyltransferase-like protein (isoleucine patch superfamily)
MHCTIGIATNVGKGTTVGHNAVLHSCEVGDDTLIGMGAILLDNVKVGNGCLVAAGSLLTPGTEIPDGSMVMGSPARVKRKLTDREKKAIMENTAEYVELAGKYKEDK